MAALSRYWKICRISLASKKAGYEYYLVPLAQEFCQRQLQLQPNTQNKDIQAKLLSHFHSNNASAVDAKSRAKAGLCLRCNVSYSILKAILRMYSLFGGEKFFTCQDLLPFVLNDDGKELILLDKDGKTQLTLDNKGIAHTKAYKFFTVEILRTYNSNSGSGMSLENWAYLQTKQNKELQNFLSEFGFKPLSDWTLMNRARLSQLERLSERDRHLVEVFHAVYRRDRPLQAPTRNKKMSRSQ